MSIEQEDYNINTKFAKVTEKTSEQPVAEMNLEVTQQDLNQILGVCTQMDKECPPNTTFSQRVMRVIQAAYMQGYSEGSGGVVPLMRPEDTGAPSSFVHRTYGEYARVTESKLEKMLEQKDALISKLIDKLTERY